jgi:hypothetical protein
VKLNYKTVPGKTEVFMNNSHERVALVNLPVSDSTRESGEAGMSMDRPKFISLEFRPCRDSRYWFSPRSTEFNNFVWQRQWKGNRRSGKVRQGFAVCQLQWTGDRRSGKARLGDKYSAMAMKGGTELNVWQWPLKGGEEDQEKRDWG